MLPRKEPAMNVKETTRIEGYWKSTWEPQYPFPQENTIDPTTKNEFVEKLQEMERIAHKEQYMGDSECRICKCTNGSREFVYKGWRWPSGYLHYIILHSVAPTDEFFEFVMTSSQ